jgi:hypothetical protein
MYKKSYNSQANCQLFLLTIYKLNKRHEDRLYNVMYSEIKYQAKKCYLKDECESSITLNELYEKKYLETMYDPISKEELNKNIKIIIKDEKIEIAN